MLKSPIDKAYPLYQNCFASSASSRTSLPSSGISNLLVEIIQITSYIQHTASSKLVERNAVIFNYKITQQLSNKQPSQNVLSATDIAVYNKVSAAYFTLVRLLVQMRFGLYFLLLQLACILLKNILTGLKKYLREIWP